MSKKEFIPTPQQRTAVFDRLCTGELAQSVRIEIINPETKKPLSLDTFCDKFTDEITNARAFRGSKVSSNLFMAATAAQKNLVTGIVDRDPKAMQQWLALEGRGLFGQKFKLDCTKPLHEQFIDVKQACADGLIGCQEMSAFVDAFAKEMQLIEFQALKVEFLEFKSSLGVRVK